MTGGELLRAGTRFLKDEGIEAPRLEAEVLLSHAWGKTRTELLVASEREVPEEVHKDFGRSLKRRVAGLPVAYLTGEKEFMSLSFAVGPEVLIPRPETELLVEKVLKFLMTWGMRDLKATVADIGAGSGAIAVSIAFYEPRAQLLATDISPAALVMAEQNALRHGVADSVIFKRGDLLTPALELGLAGAGAVVAANLPYIPRQDLEKLPQDVRCEPILALDGGDDGLALYRRLLPQAAIFLAAGGLLACEVGPGQAQVLAGLLGNDTWRGITIERDYRGEERLLLAVKS